MASVDDIFERIRNQICEDVQPGLLDKSVDMRNESKTLLESNSTEDKIPTFSFLLNIFQEIDTLRSILESDDKILISVRNQKFLRTAFQLIVSIGISPCLIPGLGLSLSKRCTTVSLLSPTVLNDGQKYQILMSCTDFFTRCYTVPVLKNIIITLHLSDYLAALIQLAFAPLKKPGTYSNFTMTQEMYDQYQIDSKKYLQVYENLVTNSFQPILMKELLVLQSVTNPTPPKFVKRVIRKEMCHRLLAPSGLLGLIRCFMDNSATDTGLEWKKIDMICRLVTAQHSTDPLEMYLMNICTQLTQILLMNNTHYLATAVACALSLNEKYSQSEVVQSMIKQMFQSLDYSRLVESDLPGVMMLSPQEVNHRINLLHACVCSTKVECPVGLLTPSLYTLFLLGLKCTKNDEIKSKIEITLSKCFEKLDKSSMLAIMKDSLFGKDITGKSAVVVEEYDAGLAIKCQTSPEKYPKSEAVSYLFNLYMKATEDELVQSMFEASLRILIELSEEKKKHVSKTNNILKVVDNNVTLNDVNEDYSNILQLLSEMSETPNVVKTLKSNPVIVLDFVEYFLTETQEQGECVTIAMVLLNTILSNSNKIKDLEARLSNLIPVLIIQAQNESEFNSILCKEALSLIKKETPQKVESKCDKAISDVYNHLLPVRAHGIIDLTKLIEGKDPETLSKKHYLFCLFQEQLKDPDSYIYLAAINGVAALGTLCTDDVLQVLCKEFLQVTNHHDVLTNEGQRQITELRMKIGDVIVKVTRNLGEMAIVHKTMLLNTMLCGCRDEDPFIRMSALSNLAEIVRVLHYKIGSIIYEVLLCIWSILEQDKAVECRRAAVMVITSLFKGLGKETLVQLKENLLPIYRALMRLHRDENEDSVIRLHAQLALDELNATVSEFLFPELKMEKQIYVLDKPEDVFK